MIRRFVTRTTAALRRRLPALALLAAAPWLAAQAVAQPPQAGTGMATTSPATTGMVDPDPALAQIQRQIQLTRSIVKIEARGAKGYALGTGVVVAPGRVAASCHVTREALGVDVLYTGLRLHATAQQADMAHDLCLLEVPELDAPVVGRAGSRSLRIDQPLLALGFSGGLGIATSRGAVIELHAMDGGQVIRSSTGFVSGASGGGLFNEAGELVGLLTFRLRGADRHYFSVPAEWLEPMLAANRADPIAPLGGRAFWEASTPPADRLAGMPHFLRATVLELEGRWDELAAEARRWLADTPGQPQAQAALARAHSRSGSSAAHPVVTQQRLPVPTAATAAASSPAGTEAQGDRSGQSNGKNTAAGTDSASSTGATESTEAPEPSQAERLLFMQAHLARLAPPLDLVYDVDHQDSSDPSQSYTDTVQLHLAGDSTGACCAVAGEFLSGPRAMRLPDIGSATANPLLLYFLEYEVRRLQTLSKGQAAHFRRRIRLALVDAATVRDIEIEHRGRRVKAREIVVSPFLTDPYRPRFEQEATRQYRFVVADELPGQFAEIDVIQAGSGAKPRSSTTRITLR